MRKLRFWRLLLLCICLFGTSPLRAQEASEAQVKAAFLYKFLGYVEWPEGVFVPAGSPLVIGVMESDDVHQALQNIVSGRRVANRPIVVRRVDSGEAVSGLHVLFIGRLSGTRLSRVLAPLRGQPVLSITDDDDGLTLGSIINFLIVDEQMRFEVSLSNAGAGGVKISSRMLGVAQRVEP